jgi:hypothetical protein
MDRGEFGQSSDNLLGRCEVTSEPGFPDGAEAFAGSVHEAPRGCSDRNGAASARQFVIGGCRRRARTAARAEVKQAEL